jgi:zinc finger SWIM domain-containing protein 3
MPFAPLLGVNRPKQTIIFGAGLLYDESAESFKWLFTSFLEVISDKHPETIFTDQCATIISALLAVFPHTNHCLCLWNLYQNAAKHLSYMISDHLDSFLNSRSVYMKRWNELLVTYNIETNKWMINLYKFCDKWATIYHRDSFSGDMTSTQSSEGWTMYSSKHFAESFAFQNY